MKHLPYLRLLAAVANELGRAAAAWRSLGSATIRAFLLQDLGAIARPCAPLMLLSAFAVAGLGLSYLLRVLATVNTAIAGEAARALLVDGGPLISAIVIVAMVLPLRVAALRSAAARGDYADTVALGIPLERVLTVPCVASHAVAVGLGAAAWLGLGLIVAPAVNAAIGSVRWLDQTRFLLIAINPLDPWTALLHGAVLGAMVGACALVSARELDADAEPSAKRTGSADTAADAARSITRSLFLAVLAIAAAEASWWSLRWLLGGG